MIDRYLEGYELMMLEGSRAKVCSRAACAPCTMQSARMDRGRVARATAARITEAMTFYGYVREGTRVGDLFPRHAGTAPVIGNSGSSDMGVIKNSLSELWINWVRSGRTGINTLRQLKESQNPKTRTHATIAVHHLESMA